MYGMFLAGFTLGFMGAVFLIGLMTDDVDTYNDWEDW